MARPMRWRKGKITGHDLVVSNALSTVLCGGNTNLMRALSEQQLLDLERTAFMELIKTEATFNRIDHMVKHGKPFREPIARVERISHRPGNRQEVRRAEPRIAIGEPRDQRRLSRSFALPKPGPTHL